MDYVLQNSDVGEIIGLCEDIYGEIRHRYMASSKKMKKMYFIGAKVGDYGDYYYLDRVDEYGTHDKSYALSYDNEQDARAHIERLKRRYTSPDQRFLIVDDDGINIDTGEKIYFDPMMDYSASARKSVPSIHDMIRQCRANNNSLVKSRVDLIKTDTSVIPDTLYINVGGKDLLFQKEEFPNGIRWLPKDDVTFFDPDGAEIFPCLYLSDYEDKALFLWEEKGWNNDYYGEYDYEKGGMDCVIRFEDFLAGTMADYGIYMDDGSEEYME